MAAIALRHTDYYRQLRDNIIDRKQRLTSWLTAKEFIVVPSFINTIVVRLDNSKKARALVEGLKRHKILINFGGNKTDKVGLDNNCVSFVVGTDQQILQLQSAIQELLM